MKINKGVNKINNLKIIDHYRNECQKLKSEKLKKMKETDTA
jgi:hypothetical protein